MAYQPKSYRKFLAGTVSAAVVASAIAPVASASFTDVAGSVHANDIATLVAKGYIKGYADGTFKPDKPLTRGEAAIIFSRILKDAGVKAPEQGAGFPDVPASKAELAEAVAIVKAAGVMGGDEKGNFNPNANITRQEMAKVVVEAFKLTKPANHTTKITDLDKAGSWAREYIQTLEANGVTKNTEFAPKQNVTRGQFASFVVRAMDVKKEVSAADITAVKLVDEKTLEVTFNGELKEVKKEDFAIQGVEIDSVSIKAAAAAEAKTTVVVIKTKTKLEEGKTYSVSYKGQTTDKAKVDVPVVTPKVESVSVIADNKIEVTFNTTVSDKTSVSNFEVSGRTVTSVQVNGSKVVLTLNSVMVDGTNYTVTVKDVYNKSETKKLDAFSYTLKYEFASVKEVLLNKTTFRANVSENIKKYIVVKDENGRVLTIEDYQVTTIDSKNHNVVDANGEVKNPGETEIRVEVAHKNGEKKWSDWIKVVSEGVTLENGISWGFVNSVPENKKVFTASAENYIYNGGDSKKLVIFRDYSNGDTIGRHVDLRSTGLDKAKVTNNTPTLIAVDVNDDGTLTVTSLDNGKTGTASITVEYELGGTTYKDTITFEVKAKPVATSMVAFTKKTLLVADKAGATDGDYKTEAGIEDAFVGYENGIDKFEVDLSKLLKDQYGKDYPITVGSVNNTNQANDGVWTVSTTDGVKAGKLVISIPKDALAKLDVAVENGKLVVKSKNEALSEFSVTFTYYKDANSNTKTYEAKLPVEVKATDGDIKSYKFIPVVNGKEVSSITLNAANADNKVTFKIAGLDKNGNVLTYEATDLGKIVVDASVPMSDLAKAYTDIDDTAANAVAAATGVGFVTGAADYYAGTETVKIKVQVAESSTVLATDVLSVALTNSNPVPVKATLTDEITIDLSDAKDALGRDVTLQDVLFGVINTKELNLDKYDVLTVRSSGVNYGPKAGFDGYVDGLAPILKLYDKDNKLVPMGATYIGWSDATGVESKVGYGSNKDVVVNVVDTKNVDSTVDITVPITLTSQLKLKPNAQKGSFTVIIDSIKLDGADNKANLLKNGEKLTVRVNLVK